MNMHIIAAEDEMRKLGASSKSNANMDFLLHLKDIGRKTAEAWLKANWQMIGEGSSVDVREMFLDWAQHCFKKGFWVIVDISPTMRAYYAGGLHLGKVRSGLGAAYIPDGGLEVLVNPYELLVAGVE